VRNRTEFAKIEVLFISRNIHIPNFHRLDEFVVIGFALAATDDFADSRNEQIGRRSALINEILSEVPELYFNPTYGAFYNTIVFKPGVLNERQTLPVEDPKIRSLVEKWTENVSSLDYRFVYYLLASTGVCVVPISSFCSELNGFRITLLEEDEDELRLVFTKIRDAIKAYVKSA